MKHLYITIIVSIVFFNFIHSQEVGLHLGTGITTQGVRDEGYSPIRYDGVGFALHGGLHFIKPKKEVIWQGGFSNASLENTFGRKMQTLSFAIINYNFYKVEGKAHAWGWSNNNVFHTRQIDDFLNYNGRTDYFTAFGPAWKYEQTIDLFGQSFTFSTMAHLQLLGFYLPSGYVSSMPSGFGYENKGFFDALYSSLFLFYPSSAYNAALTPSLTWLFSENSHLQLQYNYEYTHFRNIHTSQRSIGMWSINLAIKLKG